MNKKLIALYILIAALVVVAVAYVSVHEGESLSAAGNGPNHYQSENFLQGLTLGDRGQSFFSAKGILTLLTGNSGACATSSWNPAAVGSTSVASVDATLTGAVFGDTIAVSIATSTQGLTLEGNVSSTNSVSVVLSDGDNSGAAIDIATTTLRVCRTH